MELSFPFDPLARAAEIETKVMRGGKRLYLKFRAAPYYGGIATGDAIGCCFLCAYCWNYARNADPSRFGKFYPPEEVASTLLHIAQKRFFNLFRITGSEPILGESSFEHLLSVIHFIFEREPRASFILETNGFLLGFNPRWVERLKNKNVVVRIALKGTDADSFEKITGAKKEFFDFPFLALQELERHGIRAWPAAMNDLFTEEEVKSLERLLDGYHIKAELELEVLEPYPFVLENMKRRGVLLKRISRPL